MERKVSLLQAMLRGALFKCPQCGCGRIYRKYLSIADNCDVCNLAYSDYPCEDGPPYITICLVGFFIVPFILWADTVWELPLWFTAFVVIPVLLGLMLVMMPMVKGAYLGVVYHVKTKHQLS